MALRLYGFLLRLMSRFHPMSVNDLGHDGCGECERSREHLLAPHRGWGGSG